MKTFYTYFIVFGFVCLLQGQTFQKMEYFYNTDPGVGNGTIIDLSETTTIDQDFTLDAPPENGLHFLYVRMKQSNGQWSLAQSKMLIVVDELIEDNGETLRWVEYFFDEDPGHFQGKDAYAFSDEERFFLNLETSNVSNGLHTLYVRVFGKNGIWSQVYPYPVIISNGTGSEPNVVAMEYFFDTDPGQGNGMSIPLSENGVHPLNLDVGIDDVGLRILYVRTLNEKGFWSQAFPYPIIISEDIQDAMPRAEMEYYVGDDPGVGNGNRVDLESVTQPRPIAHNSTGLPPMEVLGVVSSEVFAELDFDEIAYLNDNDAPLYIRVKIDNELWSQSYPIEVPPLESTNLSVEDGFELTESVAVYPNPFSDVLHIKTKGEMELKHYALYDMQGRIVQEGDGSNSTLHLEQLTSGVYILRVKIDDEYLTKKVIKK